MRLNFSSTIRVVPFNEYKDKLAQSSNARSNQNWADSGQVNLPKVHTNGLLCCTALNVATPGHTGSLFHGSPGYLFERTNLVAADGIDTSNLERCKQRLGILLPSQRGLILGGSQHEPLATKQNLGEAFKAVLSDHQLPFTQITGGTNRKYPFRASTVYDAQNDTHWVSLLQVAGRIPTKHLLRVATVCREVITNLRDLQNAYATIIVASGDELVLPNGKTLKAGCYSK